MNRLAKAAVGAAALVATAGAVHAATNAATSHVVSGKIERVDAAKHRLVLHHHSYSYSPKLAVKSLNPGEKVKVFYREHGSNRHAYKIVPMAS